ncbi:hypothetical protein GCM10009678_36250 [Actinomadura kijaniata]|uniref:WD40 repeat protein n=1 Tax=Actinomadura namibiensis TaxID=182080 RepID=A0A7W3QM53_ACTNM|nr:WD40 repeat domain-containing serine/threonine-protein kinase [Actinomadura namibiensis]MBA8952199.1 WD40 repeat protein [Actinomadura namibiensis]
MPPVPPAPGEPTRLGDYWLAGKIGSGGQGVVYEGYGPDGARVAVKALHGDYSAAHRVLLAREVDAVRRVSQFCTARVLAVDLEHDPPYIVSEYVAGPTLQQAVETGGPYGPDELYRLAVGIATALTTIHRAGVVHRDLKPANVLLGPDGPRVIDFGVARHDDMSQSTTGVKGTPRYMAPEVFRGQGAGPAVDVWAWGATVLFAASGRPPFGGDMLAVLVGAVLDTEPDLSVLPDRLRPVVAAALAKDPGRRPGSSEVLLDLLGGPGGDLLEQGVRAAAAVRAPDASASAPTLGERAEEVFRRLPPAAQQAAPQVLLRMVAEGEEVVRPARYEESDDGRTPKETTDAVMRAFTRAGLLTWDGRQLMITTPALLRAWPRLREWADAERPGLAVHRELVDGVRLWDAHGRKAGDLFQGTRLDRALGWAVSGRRHLAISRAEQEFLDAGRTAARRRSTARTAVSGVLAVLLVVAVGAVVLVVQRGQTVARQRDEAEARRMAATAMATRRHDPRLARRLAVAAASLADTAETRETLVALRHQWESDVFGPPDAGAQALRQPSPDGRLLVVLDTAPGTGGTARIWEVDSRRELRRFAVPGPKAVDLVVTNDARTLVTWMSDGTVRVWDTATGGQRGALPFGKGPNAIPDGIDLNPSGNLLLARRKGRSTAWDLRTLKEVPLPWKNPKNDTVLLTAAADDRTVAGVTMNFGDRVRVRRLASAAGPAADIAVPKLNARLRKRWVGETRLSPDGSLLAVAHAPQGGSKSELLLWDLRTDQQYTVLASGDSTSTLAFTQDGRFVAQNRTMWRVARGILPRGVPPVLRYAPGVVCGLPRFVDNRILRCLEHSTGQLSSLDVGTYTSARNVRDAGGLLSETSMAADGSVVAFRSNGTVRFWDLRHGKPLSGGFRLSSDYEHSSDGTGLAISGDGARLAIRKNPRTITITDARRFAQLGTVTLPQPNGAARGMAFTPDGRGMAIVVRDGAAYQLQFWDMTTFRQIRSVPVADGGYGRLLFRADGKALLFNGQTGLVEYPSGRVRATGDAVVLRSPAALSPDGRTLIGLGGIQKEVVPVDGTTLRPKNLIMRGHRGYVQAAAFSPDGGLLATGDRGGEVRLWEAGPGRSYALSLTGHQNPIRALAFSAGGRTLESLADDGTVISYDIAPARATAALCRTTGGGLTRQEWKRHLPVLDHRPTCPTDR